MAPALGEGDRPNVARMDGGLSTVGATWASATLQQAVPSQYQTPHGPHLAPVGEAARAWTAGPVVGGTTTTIAAGFATLTGGTRVAQCSEITRLTSGWNRIALRWAIAAVEYRPRFPCLHAEKNECNRSDCAARFEPDLGEGGGEVLEGVGGGGERHWAVETRGVAVRTHVRGHDAHMPRPEGTRISPHGA